MAARKHVEIRLRICLGDEVAIGPGKADLLASIEAYGTIAGAGRQLGMSYKRAWTLVDTMNRCFRSPLVETTKGGARRGGATLTPLGQQVLASYRAMAETARQAVRADVVRLERLLAR